MTFLCMTLQAEAGTLTAGKRVMDITATTVTILMMTTPTMATKKNKI